MNRKFALATCLFSLSVPSAWAAVGASPPPREGFDNVGSLGLSYGLIEGRDADFWGWTLNYGRLVSGPWGWEASLLWDSETEDKPDGGSKRVRSYTVSSTLSYSFNDRWGLSGGVGLGIASDDNPSESMEFDKGDFSIGLIGSYTLPRWQLSERDVLSISLAAEYNISQNEPSISIDVIWGWSF